MEITETVYLNKYFQETGLMHQGMRTSLVRLFWMVKPMDCGIVTL